MEPMNQKWGPAHENTGNVADAATLQHRNNYNATGTCKDWGSYTWNTSQYYYIMLAW